MSDMTMTLQPAIGLKQLNTIGSNPRIGVANSRMGRNATMDEDAAKRRAHLGGDATYAFLHKASHASLCGKDTGLVRQQE